MWSDAIHPPPLPLPQKCYRRGTNSLFYGLIVAVNVVSLSLTIRTAIIRNSGNACPPLYSQIIKVRRARGICSRPAESS